MKNDKNQIFSPEEKIAHFLMLNACEMPDLGVLDGRMKAILFFFNEARINKSDMYSDFATELLEELFEILSVVQISADFKSGLCGIGWGVEYLIFNRYVAVHEDICTDFDKKIKQYFIRKEYSGIGLEHGLLGILLYLVFRFENRKESLTPSERRFYTTFISQIFCELQCDAGAISNLLQEADNSRFDNRMLMIYSKWEFPLLIWSVGRCAANGIAKKKAVRLIIDILSQLDGDSLPKSPVNTALLLHAFRSLSQLNVPAITAVIDTLCRKYRIEEKKIEQQTPDKQFFKFDIQL